MDVNNANTQEFVHFVDYFQPYLISQNRLKDLL